MTDRRNIEIKARCENLDAVEEAARAAGARLAARLRQEDLYFRVPEGRLKLRSIEEEGAEHGARSELIFYRRGDTPGPRASNYAIHEVTEDVDGLRRLLAESLGVVARVRKARTVYVSGPSRLHLDRVEGLGAFVEIERVMAAGDEDAAAHAEVERLAAALGIDPERLVPISYADLLGREKTAAGRR